MERMKRKGKIVPNGVILEKYEMATVVFLTELGIDVELIPKSNRKGEHTPDIKMLGLLWEMKSPKGQGKWLIKNTIQKASHQAENIVVDLRRVKIHESKCLTEIERYYKMSKRIKKVKVVTKTGDVIDFV